MMTFLRLSFYTFCFFISVISTAQKVATFEVEVTKPSNGMDVVAQVNLDNVTYTPDSALSLVALEGSKRTPVPFQIRNTQHRELCWVIKSNNTSKKQVFELLKGKPSQFQELEATASNGELTIHAGDKNLLRYVYKTVYPPVGIDSAFRRSAFIHPLWTPHGQVLTRIQAPDHYHHYGIWNPWTHVLFEGDTVDFWNLKSKKGTVRFGNFASITQGPVYAEFAAVHQHVVFKKDGPEKIALNELQTVRVYTPEKNQDSYIVDITIEMSCATNSPFKILEYRYAGLGWRATEQWNKNNSDVLTSEGKTRKDADGSTARWCIVEGALDNDFGGAVMMSHPLNYNHPEPLRIWPENSNNGEMFAMFAPTKNKNWNLFPGKVYTLNYRFVVFNGHFTKEKAESAWQYFGASPKITMKTY